MTADIAAAHARGLAHNYRNAYPKASPSATADYVAVHMVGNNGDITGFLDCAENAHDIALDYDAWYAHTIVNY